MKNYLVTLIILAAMSLSTAAMCEPTELHGHMHGLVWRVGKYVGLVSVGGERAPWQRDVPAFTYKAPDQLENSLIANRIDHYLSEQKDIKGLLIYVTWDELEPKQGVYDWDFLDRVIQAARNNDVFYKLSLMPGLHCPEWIYKQGVEVFPIFDWGRPRKVPVPWDEQYLENSSRCRGKSPSDMLKMSISMLWR